MTQVADVPQMLWDGVDRLKGSSPKSDLIKSLGLSRANAALLLPQFGVTMRENSSRISGLVEDHYDSLTPDERLKLAHSLFSPDVNARTRGQHAQIADHVKDKFRVKVIEMRRMFGVKANEERAHHQDGRTVGFKCHEGRCPLLFRNVRNDRLALRAIARMYRAAAAVVTSKDTRHELANTFCFFFFLG